MEASQLKQHRFTEEEYFEQLEQSLHKLEYGDGEISMMAGGTPNHSTIVDNTFFALRSNKGSCEVKSSETAVSIQAQNKYFFPDTSVVCGEKANYEETKGIARITNPCLIVEVLSESTADRDRGDKFNAYRQMESFKEYLLIDSRKMQVDYFYRETNDLWHIRSYYKADQEVEVRTLGVRILVGVFYEGVEFSEK